MSIGRLEYFLTFFFHPKRSGQADVAISTRNGMPFSTPHPGAWSEISYLLNAPLFYKNRPIGRKLHGEWSPAAVRTQTRVSRHEGTMKAGSTVGRSFSGSCFIFEQADVVDGPGTLTQRKITMTPLTPLFLEGVPLGVLKDASGDEKGFRLNLTATSVMNCG